MRRSVVSLQIWAFLVGSFFGLICGWGIGI